MIKSVTLAEPEDLNGEDYKKQLCNSNTKQKNANQNVQKIIQIINNVEPEPKPKKVLFQQNGSGICHSKNKISPSQSQSPPPKPFPQRRIQWFENLTFNNTTQNTLPADIVRKILDFATFNDALNILNGFGVKKEKVEKVHENKITDIITTVLALFFEVFYSAYSQHPEIILCIPINNSTFYKIIFSLYDDNYIVCTKYNDNNKKTEHIFIAELQPYDYELQKAPLEQNFSKLVDEIVNDIVENINNVDFITFIMPPLNKFTSSDQYQRNLKLENSTDPTDIHFTLLNNDIFQETLSHTFYLPNYGVYKNRVIDYLKALRSNQFNTKVIVRTKIQNYRQNTPLHNWLSLQKTQVLHPAPAPVQDQISVSIVLEQTSSKPEYYNIKDRDVLIGLPHGQLMEMIKSLVPSKIPFIHLHGKAQPPLSVRRAQPPQPPPLPSSDYFLKRWRQFVIIVQDRLIITMLPISQPPQQQTGGKSLKCSSTKVIVDGRNYTVYEGIRGGKYIKQNGKYINLKTKNYKRSF